MRTTERDAQATACLAAYARELEVERRLRRLELAGVARVGRLLEVGVLAAAREDEQSEGSSHIGSVQQSQRDAQSAATVVAASLLRANRGDAAYGPDC